MHELNFRYFIRLYIRDHRKVITFFAIVIVIFLVVTWLYSFPMEMVGYATLLCMIPALLFIIYDFYFYKKQNKELIQMIMNISETLEGTPVGKTFTENNYFSLLLLVQNNSLNKESKMNMTFNDMMDYYTMWVHQVKTPIAGMRLMLQSSGNDISDDLKKDLGNELFRIEQYVEMVLSYMRLESESTDYVIKEYDLDSIIKQSLKKFSGQFINNKISLDFNNTDMKVLTDEKWLGFALDQLFSNAVKYTEGGKVQITKCTAQKKNELLIEDTGIGISREDLPRIFEKGFTGYNGRIEKKSTGIGLFLTKMILNRLGHTIHVESDAGKGTKVTINFDREHIEHE